MSDVKRVEENRPSTKASPGFLAMAMWLGLVIGLIEVGMLLVEKQNNHIASIGALRLNRHYPWMVPASLLGIFAVFGLVLELIRRVRPSLGNRLAPLVLGTLALLALLLSIRQLAPIACLLLAGGLATQIVRRIRWLAPMFRRAVRVSLPVLVAGLALLVVGRHVQFALLERRAAAKPIAKGVPNVLLIVLDTVRARNLGLYGYPRETTPRLSRLASRGVGFNDARSAAPWTLPSHATMFTGRWPSELFEYPEQKLDSSVPTLAEHLGRNGFATAGFVANTFYCNSGFGLGRGFDHYEDFYEDFGTSPAEILRHSALGRKLGDLAGVQEAVRLDGRKDADRINADFLTWHSTQGGRPFFAFLNYMDAHAPYIVPASADRHFGLRATTPGDLQILNGWHKITTPPTDPRSIELARDAYDDCIAFLDAALGRLFDELDRRGVLDTTLVIVTSDHGEEIGEHQLVGHGRSLYGEELHVPLIVVKPGLLPSGRRIAEPVSLRDLPATIVDLVGLSDSSPFPGRSMVPLWSTPPGTDKPEPGLVRSEVALRLKATTKTDRPPALRGPMASVVAEGMSYIRNADGSEELYRLLDDPFETRNLVKIEDAQPALRRLRALTEGDPDRPSASLTETGEEARGLSRGG